MSGLSLQVMVLLVRPSCIVSPTTLAAVSFAVPAAAAKGNPMTGTTILLYIFAKTYSFPRSKK